jgi:hypothetical protein
MMLGDARQVRNGTHGNSLCARAPIRLPQRPAVGNKFPRASEVVRRISIPLPVPPASDDVLGTAFTFRAQNWTGAGRLNSRGHRMLRAVMAAKKLIF